MRRGKARRGAARHGAAWQGSYGRAWLDPSRQGKAWQLRRGMARRGRVWYGEAVKAKLGKARRGLAWQGKEFFIKGKNMGIYQWKKQANFKADAEKVYNELIKIKELTPANIVKKAEKETTELHKCFTWDNEEAAKKCRIIEARVIVKSLIIIDHSENEEIQYRAFESVIINEKKQYMKIESILSEEDLKEQVFQEIRKSINELLNKINNYKYLSHEEFGLIERELNSALKYVDNI